MVVMLVVLVAACGGAAEVAPAAEPERARVFAPEDVRVPRRERRRASAPVAAPARAQRAVQWEDRDCDYLGYFTSRVRGDDVAPARAEDNPLIACTSEANYNACIVRHLRERADECRRRCQDAASLLQTLPSRERNPDAEGLQELFDRICVPGRNDSRGRTSETRKPCLNVAKT